MSISCEGELIDTGLDKWIIDRRMQMPNKETMNERDFNVKGMEVCSENELSSAFFFW